MRILFCNFEYPPLGGGGGVVNALLAEELAKRYEVTVLTPRGFEQFPQTGAYLVAISQGIIPALRVEHTNDELRATEKAFRARGRDETAAMVSAFWPSDLNGPRWRLPSQNIEAILNDEERKEGEGDEQARKQ